MNFIKRDCIGRDRLSASKVARLYLDTESSLCRSVLAARGGHHAWFDNDTQVSRAHAPPAGAVCAAPGSVACAASCAGS